MAEKRMFSKSIIDSDLFLDMPLSSQALYFHLSLNADDEGFVSSPQKIRKSIGANDDDMKLLIAKQFIIPFETGVVVIKHWKIHNHITPNRIKDTVHQKELSQLTCVNNVYALCQQNDSEMLTDCQHIENKMLVSIDEIRLEEIRLGEKNEPDGSAPAPPKKTKSKPVKRKHGEYGHVLLSDEEYSKLISDYGESQIEGYIKKVDEYVQMTGKTYRDYNLTIRNWIKRDGTTGTPPKNRKEGLNTYGTLITADEPNTPDPYAAYTF